MGTKGRLKWNRAFELTIGHSSNILLNEGFDYVLYPYALFKFGLIAGGAIMAILSFIACLLTLWFYDWSKRDWLGIEALKGMKTYTGESKARRLISSVLQRGDWLACLLLSVKFDPFITTAYMRYGQFNGMQKRDVKIFLASWATGNLTWSLVCFVGVSGLRRVWESIQTSIAF